MGRKATSRKPSIFDRVAVACFLGLFFTALAVIVYSSVVTPVEHAIFWFGLISTMMSGVLGYLFGANRRVRLT